VIKKRSAGSAPHAMPQGTRKISARFRNVTIALFVFASVVMTTAILQTLQGVTTQISRNSAKLHAANTVSFLSTHINKDIGLISNAASSQTIIDWFADEDNPEKKSHAIKKMTELIRSLYSDNLYFGIEKSLNEYALTEIHTATDNIMPHATLDPDYYDDAWYFACIASDAQYVLNVDIDKKLHRKRVWLNHNVCQDGPPLGVLATGMEFSKLAEELFAEYDNARMRGFIIDANGSIMMDSAALGSDDFLHYALDIPIHNISSDPHFLAAVKTHLANTTEYFSFKAEPTVITLSSGPYNYATIAPIASTDWSVVTLYESSSLFSPAKLLPLFAIMLVSFIAFALTVRFLSYRLIFNPLEQLVSSLALLKENTEKRIYGIERNDEFGILSNAIHGLFNDAHNDALTGTYNRRFLDKKLQQTIESLSRSGDILTVLTIDVDYFKKYNDTYGHEMGDNCLKSIAEEFMKAVNRTGDFVARYGGEEFVAILPNTDENGASVIANRLLKNIRERNITHKSSAAAPCVTISIGGATGRVLHTQGPHDYLRRADEALYMSKQNGRNQYTHLYLEE
jgi:diguanylate cyclase (GGDEF)-like protein